MPDMDLELRNVSKSFLMHLKGGVRLPVVQDVSFRVRPATCAVLAGPSGVGKSSLLRMIYGNYRTDVGHIFIRNGAGRTDIATATPRDVIRLRRDALAYVSQFLNVIPRVGAFELVSSAARDNGLDETTSERRARELLARLNVPERLWSLPPATFSGGERQRVNIACGFAGNHTTLLLDEPTASLDSANREVVVEMIEEKKAGGCTIVGIFHDDDVRHRVADISIDVTQYASTASVS